MRMTWTFAVSAEAVGNAFAHGDTHQAKKPAHDASKVEQRNLRREGDPKRVTRTVKPDRTDAFRFTPAHVTVKRGETVRFVVAHSGKVPHKMGHMPLAPHWEAVKTCSQAAAGDAVMALVALVTLVALVADWAVALVVRHRGWVVVPTAPRVLGFTACGLAITIAIERLALAGHWMQGWSYSPQPLLIWLVRRQLTSTMAR